MPAWPAQEEAAGIPAFTATHCSHAGVLLLAEGGAASNSLAVATAYAFTSGNTAVASAFAAAITVTADRYGCETVVVAVAQAYSIAVADGNGNTFAASFSQSFSSVTQVSSGALLPLG